jgi:hypothetical protein
VPAVNFSFAALAVDEGHTPNSRFRALRPSPGTDHLWRKADFKVLRIGAAAQ